MVIDMSPTLDRAFSHRFDKLQGSQNEQNNRNTNLEQIRFENRTEVRWIKSPLMVVTPSTSLYLAPSAFLNATQQQPPLANDNCARAKRHSFPTCVWANQMASRVLRRTAATGTWPNHSGDPIKGGLTPISERDLPTRSSTALPEGEPDVSDTKNPAALDLRGNGFRFAISWAARPRVSDRFTLHWQRCEG